MYDKFNNIKINFNKKKIIITGASRGIGKKICDDFKKLGADVFSISTKNYDLSKKKDLKDLVNYISSFKKIDVLINNAAINYSELNKNFSENNTISLRIVKQPIITT